MVMIVEMSGIFNRQAVSPAYILLKSLAFLPFVMQQTKSAPPGGETEFIGKTRCHLRHPILMVFISLHCPPAIFPVPI